MGGIEVGCGGRQGGDGPNSRSHPCRGGPCHHPSRGSRYMHPSKVSGPVRPARWAPGWGGERAGGGKGGVAGFPLTSDPQKTPSHSRGTGRWTAQRGSREGPQQAQSNLPPFQHPPRPAQEGAAKICPRPQHADARGAAEDGRGTLHAAAVGPAASRTQRTAARHPLHLSTTRPGHWALAHWC